MIRRVVRSLPAAPVLRGLAVATAFLLTAEVANAQKYVNLQSTFPGTAQTGNANVSGTISAGSATSSQEGLIGRSDSWWGVQGNSNTSYGVFGGSSSSCGVYGYSSSNYGVYGQGATGVFGSGYWSNGTGVQGTGSTGVNGTCINTNGGIGVYGYAPTSWSYGVLGYSVSNPMFPAYAVFGIGDFAATGTKNFVIDHPLDPANKTLKHYCAEGAEPLNVYCGNVTTDLDGYATVVLPDWVESINRNFRYQLTVVDDGGRDDFVQVKVASRISQHQFTLRTSAGNVEVSWQVTGSRNDAWVRAHPTAAEEDKPADKRGKYWSPELYGAPLSQSIIPAIANAQLPTLSSTDGDTMPSGIDSHERESSVNQGASETGATTDGHDDQPTRTLEIHR